MNGTDEGINKFDLASGTESYHLEIRATAETISIFVKDNNPCIIPVPSFEISYTLEDFNQLSKDFKKCDSILEAKEFIIELIKGNKYSIKVENEKLLMQLIPINVQPKEINLQINKVNKKQEDVVQEICTSLQKLFIDFPKIEKETQEVKKQLSDLRKQIDERRMKDNKFSGDILNSIIFNNNTYFWVLLDRWINPREKKETKLLYQAKEGEDKSENFHNACDGKTPTLILIKTQKGNIFGGYVEKPWEKETKNKQDLNSILFNLITEKKYEIRNPDKAIFCSELLGPSFGDEGKDLKIVDGFLSNYSKSEFPYSYYANNKNELTLGETSFLVTNLEVYTIIPNN